MAGERYSLDNFIATSGKPFIHAFIGTLKEASTNVFIVPVKYEHRMDLISYRLYGTVHLQDILLMINDIVDLEQVRLGFKLYYPSLASVTTAMNTVSEFL